MAECPNLETCPVWQRFKTDLKLLWVKVYCLGDKQCECERKKLKAQGKDVPMELLPNGKYMQA